MAERKRLGLIFKVNPSWMGGTYYILNLINSFNYLEDDKRPEVVLLCSDKNDFEYALKYTNYPYLDYQLFYKKLNVFHRIINKCSRIFLRRNVISLYCNVGQEIIDIIYPIDEVKKIVNGIINIGWIPDFQEKHLPEFFSEKDIQNRNVRAKQLKKSGIKIIFSSNDAKNDYLKFYNASEDTTTAIFCFTSKIPSIDSNYEPILEKYKVFKDKYFFCGNQFWIHKNHMVLFKAVKLLKEVGYNPVLICTGNPNDYRAVKHFEDLVNYIEENGLQENIRILGLLDRNEQITLMANSQCVIQPSLFEGWNTSIEEAKAMNKFLIVSDLNVHKEQVVRNGMFFKRDSSEDLADKMKKVLNEEFQIEYYDYSKSIKESAETFLKIIE